ncbi:NUDIX hydrolase [Halospeciosus flavus]|uniref:NUDIX hydrolase n=1 Tax=Halospeciosus flavus TaxID=3032283 RepID=A0ABD5Z0R9_9EURY|nr:CoA pyrophosphatase [Halospeciosus flavus]
MTDRLDLDAVAAYDPETERNDEEAAVLVPVVRTDAGDELVFTERTAHLSTHPGEMSFPGGGREPADVDLWETARREAHEEVGIGPTETERVGQLDDVPSHFRYLVRPYVATVPDREYEPTSGEVARVVRASVDRLTDPANYARERRAHPDEGSFSFHVFTLADDAVVWGLTGHILAELLGVATDWDPDVEVREVDYEEPWPHER